MQVLKLIIRRFFAFAIITGCTAFCLSAQTTPSREYQLKAVFLFNFSQFVDWPPASFETDQSPLVIGVLGDNPFGSYLEEAVSGEKIEGHPVIVRYYKNEKEAQACHILFINFAEAKKRRDVLASLQGKSILTVSDASDFMKQGGMIRFFTSDNKIRFQISLEASRAGGLVLSSKLLRLADIFKPGESN